VHPLPEALRSRLAKVVGPAALLNDPERLLVYETDALGKFAQLPRAVVLPADTAQTAEVVRILAGEGIPVVPRGAGTGLSGGAVATADSVMIGTARMNRILSVDSAARLARVQSGVVNAQLTRLVAPQGLAYAPDPSSQTACTLGGNLAENSGGPHCLKYGVTRRYVRGVTLVDGSGAVVELGGDRAGPFDGLDLVGPVVGSEGCFGLVTEIELGLVPAAESVRTLLALFSDTAAAGEAVTAIISDGLLPAALEIIDRHTIEAVEASAYAAGYPTGVGAALVVEFDGPDRVIAGELERAEAHCRRAGATELRRAEDPDMRTRLWQGRKKAFGTMGRMAPDLMVQDATVPRSVLPSILRAIDEIAERYQLRIANVFHAGDGNLHPNILYDRRDPELTHRVEEASREIMRICVEAGGTITGEHGVGLDKRDYLRMVAGPAEIEAMRAVRDAWDPERRWNPGKVLPDALDRVGADGAGSGGEPGLSGMVAAARAANERLIPAWAAPVPGTRSVPVGSGAPIEFSPPDMSLTVPVDRLWGEVVSAAEEAGQWVPLMADPNLPVAAALRPGAAGAMAGAFGELREHLLGLDVVTGTGQLLRLGGRVVKNVAGFDLIGLFAEGALGWPTSATFRTWPIPERVELIRVPGEVAVGWPDPQLRTVDGLHLLRLGEVAGSAPDGASILARGMEAIDRFRQLHHLEGEAILELRPAWGGAEISIPALAAELGAVLTGWIADPAHRWTRVGVRGGAPVATGAFTAACAGRGVGVRMLRGSTELRAAIRDGVLQGDPSRAGAAAIADRVRATFNPTGTLTDLSVLETGR